MIKCFNSQLDDVSITSLVIRMAVFTCGSPCYTPTMKTLLACYVSPDLFMAIRTQTALAFLAEWLMALTALFLVFSMTVYKLAWHDQRFDTSGYRAIFHRCDCDVHDGYINQAPYQHDYVCMPAQYMCTANT